MLVVVKKYVVAVAQLVERRIVIPVVEGSIPFSHPTYFYTLRITTYSPYYYILSVLLHTFRITTYSQYYFILFLFFYFPSAPSYYFPQSLHLVILFI
jgi:hypothetical protein